jgi:peptide deformylase
MSRPVVEIGPELRAAVRSMFDLMYAARGIGLAANQVALPFRFFILNLTADRAQPDQEQVFINPEIVKRHASVEEEEGCLSFPGLYAKVQRARKIRVRAYDLQGNEVDLEAEDLLGRAIQHETDHLDGKLFVDYLGPFARRSAAAKIKEFEQSYRLAQAAGDFLADDEASRLLAGLATPSLDEAQAGMKCPPPAPPQAEDAEAVPPSAGAEHAPAV